jgi:hypothetical protein
MPEASQDMSYRSTAGKQSFGGDGGKRANTTLRSVFHTLAG